MLAPATFSRALVVRAGAKRVSPVPPTQFGRRSASGRKQDENEKLRTTRPDQKSSRLPLETAARSSEYSGGTLSVLYRTRRGLRHFVNGGGLLIVGFCFVVFGARLRLACTKEKSATVPRVFQRHFPRRYEPQYRAARRKILRHVQLLDTLLHICVLASGGITRRSNVLCTKTFDRKYSGTCKDNGRRSFLSCKFVALRLRREHDTELSQSTSLVH